LANDFSARILGMEKNKTNRQNKFLYLGFVAFGFYQLFFKQSLGETAIYLGIALAFDPFETTISWKNRPIWQRTILIV
jgi:hypothetical protein